MNIKTKVLYSLASVLLITGVFVLGAYVGYVHRPYVERVAGISNTATPTDIPTDFDPFWKVWNTIDEKYPGAKDISAQDRVYGAIQGLVGSLNDPYSVYFPPQDSKDFEDTINGSFEGVGMEVGIKDKVLTVIAPLKDTPAERAGIRAGDMILKIDATSTNDMSVDKAVRLIRGKQGTTIKITIFREGEKEPREISITRDVINIPTLETETKGGAFIIHLYNFGASSATQTEEALRQFKASGADKLVIDLRGNPGGYLDAAVSIGSFFLPEGDVIVTESFGTKAASDRVYRSKGYKLLDMKKTRVVVLVDKGSASASEILAGALKEHAVAPLIGETTYGKGSVQEVIDVTNNTTLKLTIARWLTPNGVSISKKGLDPDIKVETTAKDFENKKDPVMDRALQYFAEGK